MGVETIDRLAKERLEKLKFKLESIVRENAFPEIKGELTEDVLRQNGITVEFLAYGAVGSPNAYIVRQRGEELGFTIE